jgi:hypothetical protein
VLDLAPHYKEIWDSGGIVPYILNLSSQLHALAALLLGKEPMIPSEDKAVWAPELVWIWW